MQGESILAIIILIVLFYSEWKARRTFNKETEKVQKEYEERIAFYKRLPTMSREELEELRGEEDE